MPAPTPVHSFRLRVLVVEDDVLIAQDATEALRQVGAEVLGPCATEAAALECLEEHHPSAALVDLNLGDGVSFRVAQALQGWRIPFVFVTGYDQTVIPPEFAHVTRLEKPVEMREVIGSLAGLLDPAAQAAH